MSDPILANYHTHTARCHHATGTEVEYIETAIRCGYQVLGFSDHTPWRYKTPGYVSRIRMLPEELAGYVQTLNDLRVQYADRIHLHVGLEVEYFPDYIDQLAEECDGLGVEYWVFGCHYDHSDETGIHFGRSATELDLRHYAEHVQAGLETGRYLYLAHPDIFLSHWPKFDMAAEAASREVCETAARLNVPLEYNLAGLESHGHADGFLGYTNDLFWQIAAEYPIQAIVGCDAHAPEELDVVPLLRQKQAYLRSLGIPVLNSIPPLL